MINKETGNILRLVYFGRLDPVKGLSGFIEALSASDINYTFTMIGEGEEANHLRQLIEQKQLGNKVFLRARINHRELFEELQQQDVFVLPSLCYENAPLSVVEAASLGLGLFLSHHGGSLEIGKLCGAKHFFDPFSPQDIQSKIEVLYKDFLTNTIPRANKENLRALFSIETYAQEMGCLLRPTPHIVYLLPGGLHNPGGIERIIIAKANYLTEKAGFDVSIVTTEQMGRPVFYPISKRVRLHHLDIGIHEKYGKESYLRKCVSRYRKARQYKKTLALLLRQIRPDITISTLGLDIDFLHEMKDGSVKIAELHYPGNFRELSARKLSGAFIPTLVARIRSQNLRKACAGLTKLVVLTEEEKSSWRDCSNLAVIPNMLTFLPETFPSLTSKKAIAIGRLSYEKGFDLLIEAWKEVYKKHPDWELHIYGKGVLKSELQQQIENEGLCRVVRIQDPVKNIDQVYPDYSMLVLPSRFLEALPMVLLEALSFGLPLVAFDSPCGPKEVIEDKKNGFLVPTGDIQEMTERICELIESEDLRLRMGRWAKESSFRYTEEKIMTRWLTLFNQLLKEKQK